MSQVSRTEAEVDRHDSTLYISQQQILLCADILLKALYIAYMEIVTTIQYAVHLR